MSNNITNPNPNYYVDGPYYTWKNLLPNTYTLNFKDINNNVVYTYRLNPNNHGKYNGDNFKLNESIAFPISKSIFNKIKTIELNIDPYIFYNDGQMFNNSFVSIPVINFSINFLSATDLGSGVQYDYITNNNITSTGTEYIKPQCAMYTNDNYPVNTTYYFGGDPFFSVPFANHNYQYNTINELTCADNALPKYAIYNPGDQTLSMLSCEYITFSNLESSHTNITVEKNNQCYITTDGEYCTYGLENNYSIGIETFCKHGQIYFPIYLMNGARSIDTFNTSVHNYYNSDDYGAFNAIRGYNIFISFNNVPTEVPKLSDVHTSDNKACNILLDHPSVHTSVYAVEYMFIQMIYSSDTNLSLIDFKTNKQNSVDHFSSDTLNISLNQGHYIVVFNFQYPEFTGNEAFKISFKTQNNEIVIYETPEICVNNLEGSVLGNSFMNIKEIPTGFTGVITYADTSVDPPNSSTRNKFIDILLIAC